MDFDGNKGSLSVGAAFVVAGSSGNAAGAAVNVANVDNDFTAAIADATLAANSVSAERMRIPWPSTYRPVWPPVPRISAAWAA